MSGIMKAATIEKMGSIPKFTDFPIPQPSNENQKLVKVLASTIKNLDRGIVSGKHYIKYEKFPTSVGIDGVGILEETGELVYSQGITGFIAEKALISNGKYTVLPKGTDPLVAAAVPNVMLGAEMALKIRGQFKAGDVVLINGATGVTGRFASQLAKVYGAKRVIIAGRDLVALEKMKSEFGFDEIVHLDDKDDQKVIDQVSKVFLESPIDIVMDYLWGRPTDLLIRGIIGTKKYHPTKIITIGEIAGSTITLPSGVLRSSAVEILGSGLGSYPPNHVETYMKENLPSMITLINQGKLKIETNIIELKDIEENWFKDVKGKRTVVKIN